MQSSAADKQLSPQKKQQLQQQLTAEAAKRGLSLQEYVTQLREQAIRQNQSGQEQDLGDGSKLQAQIDTRRKQQPERQISASAGAPKEKAIALAKFLQSQNLKTRTCILQEKRKDMFKGRNMLLQFCLLIVFYIRSCG